MKTTLDDFERDYIDPVEQHQIDHFACKEMSRQIHRYMKAMHGSKQTMLKFEERLSTLSEEDKEKAIARYLDLNRKALDGCDFKVILARCIANYCDTFQYMLNFINNKKKMIYYYHRIKEKYIRFHEVFEKDGKFGIRDHDGQVIVKPKYDFLRTPYVYVDDLMLMPIIAEKDEKFGLILPDYKETVFSDFIYDDISLRDEYPYFEAKLNGKKGYIDKEGNFK